MDLPGVEIIDHTGDIGIRITAPSREKLFATAAKAMVQLILPSRGTGPTEQRHYQATGDDDEQLLVNWLSEINFYFQTEQFLPCEILTLEMKDNSLEAGVTGNVISLEHDSIHTDIKAVTYHRISVKETHDLWTAQVIFDI
jgi:SHS2 domain-containing protein